MPDNNADLRAAVKKAFNLQKDEDIDVFVNEVLSRSARDNKDPLVRQTAFHIPSGQPAWAQLSTPPAGTSPRNFDEERALLQRQQYPDNYAGERKRRALSKEAAEIFKHRPYKVNTRDFPRELPPLTDSSFPQPPLGSPLAFERKK